MSLLHALVLGLIQGITEFLPVSSSGHLVIVPLAFGWPYQGIFFDVVLHGGTLVALFVYFRKEIIRLFVAFGSMFRDKAIYKTPDQKLLVHLIVGTIPAVILGLLLSSWIESIATNLMWLGVSFLITAAVLATTLRVKNATREMEDMKMKDAIMIGLAQGLALLPAVSRSGATISAGVVKGLKREAATYFSFLLGTIGILAAFMLSIYEFAKNPELIEWAPMIVGFFASLVSSYLAIKYFIAYVKKHGLGGFALYVTVLGVVLIIIDIVK